MKIQDLYQIGLMLFLVFLIYLQGNYSDELREENHELEQKVQDLESELQMYTELTDLNMDELLYWYNNGKGVTAKELNNEGESYFFNSEKEMADGVGSSFRLTCKTGINGTQCY